MSEVLPDPPSNFSVSEIVQSLSSGFQLWRIYFRAGDHPVMWPDFRYFGPTSSRFDHHLLPTSIQERGIIYSTAGSYAVDTAFAEVFQDTKVIDRFRNDPWLASYEITHSIELLDTGTNWPLRAGGNMAINSGSRVQSRKWSQEVYKQYPNVLGIWFPSSLTNQPCAAIYERAISVVTTRAIFNRPLNDPALLPGITHIASQLNYLLV